MKLKKYFAYLLSLMLMCVIYSCNRYIDTVKSKVSTPIMQGYFDFYSADSNVLVFKTNVGLKRDTETVFPKAFKVKLPKGLKFYEISGSTDFGFYYANNQVVFINVKAFDNVLEGDTSYSPQGDELGELTLHKLSTTNNKYNIKNIPINDSRMQTIIKKGSAMILLYNIKQNNYSRFLEYIKEFSFIDR